MRMDWIIDMVRTMRKSTTTRENMDAVSGIMPVDSNPQISIPQLPDPNEKKRRRVDEYSAPTPPRKKKTCQ